MHNIYQQNAFSSTYPEHFAPNEAVIETTQVGTISRNSIEMLKNWLYKNQQNISNHLASSGTIPRIYTTTDITKILNQIDQWLYFKIGEWKVYFRTFKELEDNMNQVNNIITSLSQSWIDYAMTWHNPNKTAIFSKVSIKSFVDSFRLKCSPSQVDFLSRYTKITEVFDKLSNIKIGTCVDIYNALPEFVKGRINFLLNTHPSNYKQHNRVNGLDNDMASLHNFIQNCSDFKEVDNKHQLLDLGQLPPYLE